MKIHFEIDPESYVDPLPKHIGVTEIITIIGNLIDNAFESVIFQDKRNDALNGDIDVINGKEGGAIFTVFLPKGVK